MVESAASGQALAHFLTMTTAQTLVMMAMLIDEGDDRDVEAERERASDESI